MDVITIEEINEHIDAKIAEVKSSTDELKSIVQGTKITAENIKTTTDGIILLKGGAVSRYGSVTLPITNGSRDIIYLEPFWLTQKVDSNINAGLQVEAACGNYAFENCSCTFTVTDDAGRQIASRSLIVNSGRRLDYLELPCGVKIPKLRIVVTVNAGNNYSNYMVTASVRIAEGTSYGV